MGGFFPPAYDINPTLLDRQTLLINRSANVSDLDILLDSAEEYMLSDRKAATIIAELKTAMRSWRVAALNIGFPRRDIEMLESRFGA